MLSLRASLAASAVAVTACSVSAQFSSQGMDLLNHLDLTELNAASGNSCWGWVSPGGNEYAIMGLNNKVTFVRITNPTNPVIVGSIPHSDSLWADIKVQGNYAYVSNETGGGLQVINMANLDSGSVNLVRSITANGMSTTHTLALDPVSGFLYSCGSNIANGGLVIYSLADPSNPVQVGTWATEYVHEAHVITYTTGPYAGKQIAFCFNGGSGMRILDVTNKNSIQLLSTFSYPGLSYCHQGWTTDDRQFLYLNDELDGTSNGVLPTLTRIVNISNLSAPTLAGTSTTAANPAIDHNLYIKGQFMYQSNYTSGLRVFDISTPATPVEVAWIDTFPTSNAESFNGTWSNYPYFPSGTIIISDLDRGLFITRLNLNYLTFAYPNGQVSQVLPFTPTPVTVQISNLGAAIDPTSVRLFTKIDNGSYTSVPMTSIGGNQFRADLPPAPCLSTVSYYVSAKNTLNSTFTSPANAPASAFSALSFESTTTSLSYNMEAVAGWALATTGDTATTGQWQRGDPEPTAAQPGDDHTPGAAVNCWVTGRTAGASVGANDVDGGFTTLLSPVINLAGASVETRIGYWIWYSNDKGAAPNEDTFRVDISSNGGSTWVNATTIGPAGAATSGGWNYYEFRVADKTALTSNMRLRYVADDANSGSIVEAAVDDFSVFTYTCGNPCPTVTDQPDNVTVGSGQPASFTIAATGNGVLTYQWKLDGSPISNGGAISGATTATLTINPATQGDQGSYTCTVTNACGSATSNAATLTVTCPADFDGTGFVDTDDFDAFVVAFEAGDQSADFDGTGFVDTDDFDAYVQAFESGC